MPESESRAVVYPMRPGETDAGSAPQHPGAASKSPSRSLTLPHGTPQGADWRPRQTRTLPAEDDPRYVVGRRPDSPAASAFRVLRHRLALQGNPRVIAASSALSGQGATTCALNLSLALAEEDLRVLLLEANGRRPILAKLFGVGGPFNGSFWASFAVAGTLDIAALTATDGRASLGRQRLVGAVAQARSQYEYIVIDSPPILEAADAQVCAACADTVLLAIRAGNTRKRHLQQAASRLAPVPIGGTILIDALRSEG